MTDAQFAAVMSCLAVVGAAAIKLLHWLGTRAVDRIVNGFDRMVTSVDLNTAATREAAKAQVEHAAQFAQMSTKLDGIADWVHEHTPVEAQPAYHAPARDPPSERRRLPVREVTPTELPGGLYHNVKRKRS